MPENEGIDFTPRDVIVYTCRYRFFGYWLEAEPFADEVLAELRAQGYEIVKKSGT